MDQFLEATITGLATAAILAVAASGLVLTYTTTGIFNFAHGAMGMLGAFAYWQLRFDWGWPAPVALVVVLGVLAPLLGVVIERVVMRGLHDAPETVPRRGQHRVAGRADRRRPVGVAARRGPAR